MPLATDLCPRAVCPDCLSITETGSFGSLHGCNQRLNLTIAHRESQLLVRRELQVLLLLLLLDEFDKLVLQLSEVGGE